MLTTGVVLVGLLFSASAGFCQLAEGDYCWTVRVTEDHSGPVSERFLMQLHFSSLDSGDNYFAAAGKLNFPGDRPGIMTGTAMVDGSVVYLNLTFSRDPRTDSEREVGIIQMRLNSATLNGPFFGIQSTFNTATTRSGRGYVAGKMISRTCP